MHTSTVLDLITARENAAATARDDLLEQITELTGRIAAIDVELADLATTRQTLITIVGTEATSADTTVISEPYQQILAVFAAAAGGGLRAKDVCRELRIGTEPRNTESIRARLKRLANRQVLTETEPGLFTLTPKRT